MRLRSSSSRDDLIEVRGSEVGSNDEADSWLRLKTVHRRRASSHKRYVSARRDLGSKHPIATNKRCNLVNGNSGSYIEERRGV